jgi:anaerobic dimethyl sulfoxide reductase subunit B (iron-sulfur subunit)
MVQYGFFFDETRCVSCHNCAVACKDWNDVPPGPGKMLRLFDWETGDFPNVRVHNLFAPCYHCENPVCVDAANGAMYKEEKYGAVLIDPDKATSASLKAAAQVCPYGAITFDSDAPDSKAVKCNMCIDKLELGEKPVCVMSCMMRGLDFDTLENLMAKYGTVRQLEGMPDPSAVKPAVVFKPRTAKKTYVRYDPNKAIPLLIRRDPLPPLVDTPEEVGRVPREIIGRGQLVLKAKSTNELIETTRNDEG